MILIIEDMKELIWITTVTLLIIFFTGSFAAIMFAEVFGIVLLAVVVLVSICMAVYSIFNWITKKRGP